MSQDRNAIAGLRPLTARSVVLSTLLGAHPPELPVSALVRFGEMFGIVEGTVRVALSRLVAAGELTMDSGRYRLTARLLERQRRQDESRSPRTRQWRGRWEIAIVTAEGRSAADRAALRGEMGELRLAQLREGVWVRPANLRRKISRSVTGQCTLATGEMERDPGELAASLWDLRGWAAAARPLIDGIKAAPDPAERITIAAAIARHLLSDPLLPAELLPAEWPGEALRASYAEFLAQLRELLVGELRAQWGEVATR